MGGRVAWLEEGGREKNVRAAILSLGPPKLLLSPNWGENEGEKGIMYFGLNCHFSATFWEYLSPSLSFSSFWFYMFLSFSFFFLFPFNLF